MLRVFFAVSLAALLTGCASGPKPSITHPAPSIAQKKKAPAAVKAAPVAQPTPSQQIKQRWRYFAIPKWLHK